MNANELKKSVAIAALDYIYPGTIIGVGTGSTVSYFIKALSSVKNLVHGAVSSSRSSTFFLKKYGIPVYNLNDIKSLTLYIDSADEINFKLQMIKGGGAALTKEKIIASVAKTFICIVDESKLVKVLGKFPLPIEIIPMSVSYILSELIKLGGNPKVRKNIVTENGNIIIDVYNFKILNPIGIEEKINSLPGVVSVGLFATRTANIALVSTQSGIQIIKS
ncbi:ribose-5-phosphate isomerase RpiA [Buchnera aphidicola]|uniref:Ribose-5-phosphate isomerase A n=1 Tax=Buchnera aphidicola subsp. Melaphis rhois TaxID=118103 RepID=A0A4D6YBK1_BUCMH|nr:ribose-5-phosphate isomerase RpiA [Buchnera aphidicola]QCI23384.1 ribose-5-phosphate isomerase RpiA [Buchnera aphidicola (Melaphis rhois)]